MPSESIRRDLPDGKSKRKQSASPGPRIFLTNQSRKAAPVKSHAIFQADLQQRIEDGSPSLAFCGATINPGPWPGSVLRPR